MMRLGRLVLLSLFVVPGLSRGQNEAVDRDRSQVFETSVRPILEQHCLRCHGADGKTRGGLDLTSRAGLLKGGDLGPAVDLDLPGESLLIEAITYAGLEMPPTGKLDPDSIAILTEWVNQGAQYSGDDPDTPTPSGGDDPEGLISDEDRRFWSFQAIQRPEVPDVRDAEWVRDPIDAFVLRKLEDAGLSPAPEASKATLIRRLSYDLTGLPPTPEEVEAFLADESPDAYEALVDRLLDSPHYGERWGRHWLDVVRYAESNSFERDNNKPNAWRYRDYVIKSLNDDKPYNRFLLEQLAGDELDDVSAESIIATGFYRLGAWDDEPTDPPQARFDELDDILSTTSQAMLGLTINCARCHDHKIDPIPQRDYYRFLAFFHNLKPYSYREDHILTEIASDEEREAHEHAIAERSRREAAIQENLSPIESKLLATVPEPRRSNLRNGTFEERRHVLDGMAEQELSAEELDLYRALIGQWKAIPPVPPLPMALSAREDGPQAPETAVLIRGSAHAPGEAVTPGFPEVLGTADPTLPAPSAGATSSGRRRVLAEWIASPNNPLTARVAVNRVWHYHFSRGIVRSPNDFGFQGSVPTHPALLDWLAAEFMENDWRFKPLHKQIVMSSTYRMSSQGNPKALAIDPENDLFWRFNLRRLSAEEFRDAMLAVTGTLNPKMGGPSFYPEIQKAYLAGQSRPGAGWGQSSEAEQARRSVYIYVKRSLVTPILASFDAADTDFSCPVRFATTQPTQALSTLNGPLLHEQASALSARVRSEIGGDLPGRIRRVLHLVTSRTPSAEEINRGIALVEEFQDEHGVEDDQAFHLFCLLALNLNEFLYID
ncbi:PSD1 and planctomycete cytochrome C domain-containing protein [Tautonia marina]|uniref:PSD1 and planctomycete cytochrome C domain-containing protein n=1 Tax=Tautonia marina TaxID=2653855 RepID=UPI00126066E0|nr:PSD1 and planctomycete cytochrome C domain-containing protein [Tautonia marina]